MVVVNSRFLTQSITGVQRYAIEICLELKKNLKENIVFVSPSNIKQKEYAEKLSVKVVGCNKGYLWEQIDLPLYLRKKGNPLLLCLCNTAPIYYRNKIVTVHDVAFEAYPQTFNKVFLRVYRFIIPKILKSALKVITVSQFSKEEIIKYYGIEKQKIVVVYGAVAHIFHLNKGLNVKKNKYFLAVSSLNYRKNFISVLQAFEIYEKNQSDVFLYIVGDVNNNNFKNIDIARYKNDSQIKFLGRVSDEKLVEYYNNACAFIFPSIYEGFGIPPLEAQACGCPVLVSDIPSLREVVAESGMYCNPNVPKDIADGMRKIINNPNDLKKKGFENVKRFSYVISAKQIYDVIVECWRA